MTQTITDSTPASGDVKLGPDGQPIVNAEDQANADPIMSDIEAIFGAGDMASGDVMDTSGTPAVDQDGRPIAADSTGQAQAVNEFDGMTAEQRATHFQSLYNRLENEHSELKPAYEKYKDVAEFINQVYDDDVVRQAFLAELAPDLVKPTDPYDALQEQLGKEFGTDYVPDEDESSKPLSKSWRYFKRVDELYKELTEKGQAGVPKSLKDLRADREAAKLAANSAAEKEKTQTMADMKWGATDWNEYSEWLPKLKHKHLSKMFQNLRGKRTTAPNLINQAGGTAPTTMPGVFKELDNYFG